MMINVCNSLHCCHGPNSFDMEEEVDLDAELMHVTAEQIIFLIFPS
jgi:hypothetical protein